MNARIINRAALPALAAVFTYAAWSAGAHAQVLDQTQTEYPYSFNGDATWAIWQQSITVGIAGRLASIDIYVYEEGGPLGSAEVYINAGPPWQTDEPDYLTVFKPTVTGWNSIDLTAADLHFDVDDVFVIGINGIDDDFWFGGSSPSPGGPYDRGALWFEYQIYQDDQYDMAFRTWMLVDCPADITGDGVVDVLDLLEVLGQWGTSGSADITGDGTVDVLDLLEVLAAWGPCV